MGKGNKRVKDKSARAKINPRLEGFEVSVNTFGEVKSTLDIDKINTFLNEEVEDKKLVNREKEKGKMENE